MIINLDTSSEEDSDFTTPEIQNKYGENHCKLKQLGGGGGGGGRLGNWNVVEEFHDLE